MEKTSVVCAEIDPDIKEDAEKVLSRLAMTPSEIIRGLYSHIVRTKGIPFNLQLTTEKPVSINGLNSEQLNEELAKGMKSIKTGKIYTADEVDEELTRDFNI